MAKEILRGVSASAGIAEGIARVANSAQEALEKVKEGDILVVISAGPKLTPAITKSSAVVANLGGILSHAAIVCREFGIPAVVGTSTATKCIKDGSKIIVDANKGVIYEV